VAPLTPKATIGRDVTDVTPLKGWCHACHAHPPGYGETRRDKCHACHVCHAWRVDDVKRVRLPIRRRHEPTEAFVGTDLSTARTRSPAKKAGSGPNVDAITSLEASA
jgi:hypothetical protein